MANHISSTLLQGINKMSRIPVGLEVCLITRECNSVADKLAKEALGVQDACSSFICSLLQVDLANIFCLSLRFIFSLFLLGFDPFSHKKKLSRFLCQKNIFYIKTSLDKKCKSNI